MPDITYIEARLLEWCEWMQWRDYMLEPRHLTVEQWIIESNYSRTGKRPKPDSYLARLFRRTKNPVHSPETKNKTGDGGLLAMVQRMERARGFDNRGREIDYIVQDMPRTYRAALRARYRGPHKEAPRSERQAAIVAGVPRATYQRIYQQAVEHVDLCLWLRKRAA